MAKVYINGHMSKLAAVQKKTLKIFFFQNQQAYYFETLNEASGKGAL